MNNTLLQDAAAHRPTLGRAQMIPTRQTQPQSDSSVSKRVCFYKSGDYTFSGHRMIISVRTFKTFDALVDALSKKVPLPFGVRTITTPKGTHLVKNLDDLHDGGSYVCSDQRRVKPFNLSKVNWRQIPWNTTRPLSARAQKRLQFGQIIRRDDVSKRPTKVTDRVAVRTPKRLVVIRNKDRAVKHTLVLHRRTAPTFEALLDHLSQILRFPVQKLYSTDGRRVDGLAALILCSGVVVAAGSEPFKPGNASVHRKGQMKTAMNVDTNVETFKKPTRAENQKSTSSGRTSRKFSLSSERYIINQINKSRNGSGNNSSETEVKLCNKTVKTCGTGSSDNEPCGCILPHEDDIEKTFCVNQDGSMTVEMKVHLTIKEEEMLHWTTTLSRASLTTKTVGRFTDRKGSNCEEGNCASKPGKDVCFREEQVEEDETLGKKKTRTKRPSTPGRRQIQRKEKSVESVDRKPDGGTTEGHCITRRSSSSSSSRRNRSMLKAEEISSARTNERSSNMWSGHTQGLQREDDEKQLTENESHVCGSDGSCCSNNLSNEAHDKVSTSLHGHTVDSEACEESGPGSGCRPSHTQQDDVLSNTLSSGKQCQKETDAQTEETALRDQSEKNKRGVKPVRNNDTSKTSTGFSADQPGSVRKKTSSSSVNTKKRQKSQVENKKIENPSSKKSTVFNGYNVNTVTARPQMKKSISDILKPRKTPALGKKTVIKPKLISENLRDRREPSTQFNRKISNSSLNPTPSEIHQYVETWLEGISQERAPCAEGVQEEPRSKVLFQIGGDSESEEGNKNGNLNSCPAEQDLSPGDVPENKAETDEQNRDQEHPEVNVRDNQSAEVTGPTDVSSSPRTTVLATKANINSVLRQVCSSFEIVGRTATINATSEPQRSNSLPEFPPQVALVLGSSCRAFLTFLTVMTLRDCLRESDDQSRKSSEATQMMKHLMRISDVEDEEEQKTSLTHVQSRASGTFEEQWRKFQLSEEKTASNNVSGSGAGLDAVSEGGAVFDHRYLDQLMDELNVPSELRADVSLTILQAIGFQRVEHRTCVETLEKMISQTDADVILHVIQNKSKLNENKEVAEASEEQSECREESGEKGRTDDEGRQPENKGEEEENGGKTWKDPEGEEEEEEVSDRDSDGKEKEETKAFREENEMVKKSENKFMEETDQDQGKKKSVGTSIDEEEEEMDRDEGEADEEQSREESCDETKGSEGAEKEDVEDVSEGEDDEEEEEEEGITEDRIERNGEGIMITSEEEEVEENKTEQSKSEDDVKAEEPEAEKENDFKENPLNEEFHQESTDDSGECCVNVGDKEVDEVTYKQQNSDVNEEACVEQNTEASTTCSTEGQCENTLERAQGGEQGSIGSSRPAGMSQDLLDFVNSALRSSSLTFTYDTQGNVKLVPENSHVVDENSYGLKRLPSFTTSDLSDYRPETSESGGYKSQDSVDLITESERAASGMTSSDDGHEDKPSLQAAEEHLQRISSKCSWSCSSAESDTKDSTEEESGSLKTDTAAASGASTCVSSTLEDNTADGVLIDRGRWLLKENHLIRRSPPECNGMYDHVDSSSVDTGQEVTSEECPSAQKNQTNPLAAISSSELEEMAKPPTPKCNFFNMSHGSDSDPFPDDSVVHGRTNQCSSVRGRADRVSPTDTHTSKAVANKSNSMSSFASVEFKMPGGKVHPEGVSSVVTQPRRTSSGGRLSLQARDSTDSLRVRCGQYCPII